jgi:hypothetical protein
VVVQLLKYIRDISIVGGLGLYPYPTISVGEAPYPPSHVPLYIQLKAQANTSITLYTNSIILQKPLTRQNYGTI